MNSRVKIAASTASDGSIRRSHDSQAIIHEATIPFLKKHHVSEDRTVLVRLDYNSDDFCRYDVVDETAAGEGMTRDGRVADGLATQTKNLALFLPLADCIGMVLYDPGSEALMLTHLGRHNLEQNGGQRSVEFMSERFGTRPESLEVFLGPSAGHENYPLFAFDGRSLADVATEQLRAVGITKRNIEISPIDTTKDLAYFSHSEFLKGHRETDGRFAIAAMLVG